MINEEPDYWPRYTIKDHHRLRHQFSESEKIKKNWSQSMQDMFVLSMLDGKRNGVYVEIGADKPKIINNSYLLEKRFGWRGVSFELDEAKVKFFNLRRKKNVSVQMQHPLIIKVYLKKETIQNKLTTSH